MGADLKTIYSHAFPYVSEGYNEGKLLITTVSKSWQLVNEICDWIRCIDIDRWRDGQLDEKIVV